MIEALVKPSLAILLTGLCALLPLTGHAQMKPDWARTHKAAHGEMLALDSLGNAFIAGSVPWSTMLIAKYDASGTALWQRIFDHPGTREQTASLAVDAAGNALVTGYFIGGDRGAANALVVLKYSPTGALLWQDIVTTAHGYASRVGTDAAGNVYVLGRAWAAGPGGERIRLVGIKYAPDGTREWLRDLVLDALSADAPAALAVAPQGSLIVVGGASTKMLIAVYDASGNLVASKSMAGSPGDVALGPSGEIYVVGGPHANPADRGFIVFKHDANFNEIWRKTYDVGRWGWRIAVDSRGHAVIAGVAGDTRLDWMTIKIDPNGTLLWSRRHDQHRHSDEIPFAVVVGADDAVYVTGQAGPAPAHGVARALGTVTVKYGADGTPHWAASSFESDRGLGVKLSADGGVYVVGESPLTLLRYAQSPR
jgi:outer membrane protein assembly factor BamB